MTTENAEVSVSSVHLDDVNTDLLVACCSGGCFSYSIYTDTTNCWGCAQGGQVLCIDFDIVGLKPSKQENVFCLLAEGRINCIKPVTCCQFTSQFFCLDARAALPCTKEVPCQLNMLGMNCIYKKKPVVACLNNQKQLEEKLAAKQAPAGAAPSLEMTR